MFRIAKLMPILLAASLAVPIAGCTSPADMELEEQPVTASQYMVNLNDMSGKLADKLQEFSDSVGSGKISAMQTKAQEAYAVLDEMAALEAPDDISEIKQQYDDAATQLKGALNDYMALYTEIYDSADMADFDYSSYTHRIEDVQKQYDNAIGALEDADKKAAEM